MIMLFSYSKPSSLRNVILVLFAFTFTASVLSAPSESPTLNTIEKRDIKEREAIAQPVPRPLFQDDQSYVHHDVLKRASAELYWGPVYIGNLKLSLTNPHEGYAGPKFPWANHVNFHVDKKDDGPRGTYSAVVNLHIVKYTNGDSQCLYAWDSVTKKVVFDKCFDDFAEAIPEAVGAIKDFVHDLLKDANFWASIVIIGALVVALAACLASLGAVALA